jgi:hypothetical protein
MRDDERQEPDLDRRNVGTALLGALGATIGLGGLTGCTEAMGPEPIDATALAATTDRSNYAALRAIATKPGGPGAHCVFVLGHTQEGDGGGGIFVWDETLPLVQDNGGTVIKPNDRSPGEPGRWKRMFSNIVDVRWFGASPDPNVDSTSGVVAALKASNFAHTVYFPRGTYSVDADRLTIEALVMHGGAHLKGELHSSAPLSVIRARTNGSVLVRAGVRVLMEDLILDCASKTSRGLELLTAHASYLRNIVVRNAQDEGIFASRFNASTGESTAVRLDHVVAELCGGAGIKLVGADGAVLTNPIVQYNGGPGIEVVGPRASEPSSQGGSVLIEGGIASRNAKQNWPSLSGPCVEPQIRVRGAKCGRIAGIFIVSDSAAAVELSEGTTGFAVEDVRVDGTSSNQRAFHLLGAVCSEVRNCHVDAGHYAGVRIEDTSSVAANGNRVLNGDQIAASGDQPLLVERKVGTQTWTAVAHDAALVADSPPTLGAWREGTVIRNASPLAGEPALWVCVDGASNTWLPIYPHEAPASEPGSGTTIDANASSVIRVRGGAWTALAGGFDGKHVTLIAADPTANLSLGHMQSGGNLHLAGATSATLAPGASITLTRVTPDAAAGEGWPDSISIATRWRETARSS